MRDMRKDFGHRPGEHVVTWLLRCWDNRASSLELEGKEAKQLGSLSREGGIDKAIGKGAQALSLWRQLLSGMKERYPFKEDVIYHPGKWTTMERGIQYLRELAMLEVIYGDLDNEQLSKDPDEVRCTRPTWRKLVRSAPSSYANSLAILTWKDGEGPMVDEAASQLRQKEESSSSSLISAVEKLVQRLEEDRSYFPPPEGKHFGISPEEEVTCTEEAPLYNKLPENEKQYALFTDGSCRIVGKLRRWKAAVWRPIQQVVETAEGEGESSQFAEVKAIQPALDIADREKWPVLCLCTDSWMVANALWGWLQQWKQSNWQRRGKPIWAAALWQGIAARVENLVVKVHHVDAHVPKSRATEEHQNNQQVDQAAKIEVAQVDLDWQHKGELFIAQWAHDTSGHQGRDATYRWAHDRGVDLTMDTIAQVIRECETCAAIKQAKRLKPLWYGGRRLK
ncbi:hypothetical protein QYF61_000361 [Mycteria americana]|uniref:RNase H type-1 domain-containing protein n=1 Tax=Mycteria americana TaxID=33587 RepID=A0AAN7RJX5_MYCAM|nr:hypothetical protein QYF61_000361 [Mycteria americana]